MKPRYNSFLMIHKALRAMLMDATLELQHADFLNIEKTTAVLKKLEIVVDMFEMHASHEDSLVLPMIQELSPETSQLFEAEHVKDHELGERLKAAIESINTASDAAARLAAGQQLLYIFYDFVAFNFAHMNKEETILNEVIWKYYSDEAILKVNQQIVQRNTPAQMQTAAYWMLKGCNNAEITGWLKALKASAPEAVFQSLSELSNHLLPAERREAIAASLAA